MVFFQRVFERTVQRTHIPKFKNIQTASATVPRVLRFRKKILQEGIFLFFFGFNYFLRQYLAYQRVSLISFWHCDETLTRKSLPFFRTSAVPGLFVLVFGFSICIYYFAPYYL